MKQRRKIGDRSVCKRCGQEIEWWGGKHKWLDRGSDTKCGPYIKRGEVVQENYTKRHIPCQL